MGDARKSNDDTPSTLKVQVKSNLASLGAVSSFSQYRKTVLSETVDAESKEGGKIHYSGSFIVPLDVDPYAALWVAISQTDLASGSFSRTSTTSRSSRTPRPCPTSRRSP